MLEVCSMSLRLTTSMTNEDNTWSLAARALRSDAKLFFGRWPIHLAFRVVAIKWKGKAEEGIRAV